MSLAYIVLPDGGDEDFPAGNCSCCSDRSNNTSFSGVMICIKKDNAQPELLNPKQVVALSYQASDRQFWVIFVARLPSMLPSLRIFLWQQKKRTSDCNAKWQSWNFGQRECQDELPRKFLRCQTIYLPCFCPYLTGIVSIVLLRG